MKIDGIEYNVKEDWRFVIRHPKVWIAVITFLVMLTSMLAHASDPTPWAGSWALGGGGRVPLHL